MTKKPIWKPFNPKEVVEGNKIFIEEIATLKTRLQDFEYHRDSAKPHSVPTMKAHFAIVCALLDYQLRNMEFLQGFLESFVELNDKLATVLQGLDKEIQAVNEKTGVDLTKIKTEIARVKETVNAPIYKFAKEVKENEEKLRKMGEINLDYATRSH